MASIRFVVGHTAKLKSGGPWMTITKDKPEAGSKFVETSWFDGATLSSQLFQKDALEPSPETVKAAEAAANSKASKAPGSDE